MKQYLVTVLWNDPYPKQNVYRVGGSNFIAAVGKGLRDWRKEFKGRRVKMGMIKFQHYATTETI